MSIDPSQALLDAHAGHPLAELVERQRLGLACAQQALTDRQEEIAGLNVKIASLARDRKWLKSELSVARTLLKSKEKK